MLIDTHTHLNFEAFEKDWKAVVERAVEAGVEQMLVVGTDVASSERAVEMARQCKELFAAVGIHPHHARNSKSISGVTKIGWLAKQPKVVAIGEIGLDYHVYKNTKYETQDINVNLQKRLLGAQIEIAKKVGKPVILHSREAGTDTLDVVEHFSKSDGKLPQGVWHCFDGSKKFVQRVLEKGFYVSFTGNVTYVADRAAVAKEVPLERLLLETDCPYMPVYREERRSEPKDVIIIGQFHAKEQGIDEATIAEQTSANAVRLFRL